METQAISQVTDRRLRSVLTSVAENLEKMLEAKEIDLQTPIMKMTQYGLKIGVTLEQKAEDKPIIYMFTYEMDEPTFQAWAKQHAYLLEGPLAFLGKGIEIVVPLGAEKYDKTGFSIDDESDKKIWFELLNEPTLFRVHRDVISPKEWRCFIEHA